MNLEFTQGYRDGMRASEILQDGMSEEELSAHLEQSVDLGLMEHAGYWAGRMTVYGSDPALSDGTLLSYGE